MDHVTVDGTAWAGGDYEVKSGTLVFTRGESLREAVCFTIVVTAFFIWGQRHGAAAHSGLQRWPSCTSLCRADPWDFGTTGQYPSLKVDLNEGLESGRDLAPLAGKLVPECLAIAHPASFIAVGGSNQDPQTRIQ